MRIEPNNTTLVNVVEKSANFTVYPTFGNTYFRCTSNLEISISSPENLIPGSQWLFKAINCTLTFKAQTDVINLNGSTASDWVTNNNYANVVLTYVRNDNGEYVFDLSGQVDISAP